MWRNIPVIINDTRECNVGNRQNFQKDVGVHTRIMVNLI
jgi:hypothetical protein